MTNLEGYAVPGMQSVVTSPIIFGASRKCARTAKIAGQELSNNNDAKILLAIQLHTSVNIGL